MKISAFSIICILLLSAEAYGQNFDHLTKIQLKDDTLINFIQEYKSTLKASETANKKNAYVVKIDNYSKEKKSYTVSKIDHVYQDESQAPLAYAIVEGDLILLQTGIDHLVASPQRLRAFLQLIRKYVPVKERASIPPHVNALVGQMIICDGQIQYKEFLPQILTEYSCIIEEPAEKDEE